jgi:hypothetical protein
MVRSRYRTRWWLAAFLAGATLCVALLLVLQSPVRLVVDIVDLYLVGEGDPGGRSCPPGDHLMVRVRVQGGLQDWVGRGTVVASAFVDSRSAVSALVLTESGDLVEDGTPISALNVVDVAVRVGEADNSRDTDRLIVNDLLRDMGGGKHLSIRLKVSVFTGVLADSEWVSLGPWRDRLSMLLRGR